jgi:GTP-sensing pleiotropic transcriptional regulator CodY
MSTVQKKRGRPVGAKNKINPVSSFVETLKEWDEKEKEVNFKDLCQKLQEALAKAYCDIDQLEQHLNYVRNEVQARDVVIRYLESRSA